MGPQRLLGTSSEGIVHHPPRVFQRLLWTTLWMNGRVWGGSDRALHNGSSVYRRIRAIQTSMPTAMRAAANLWKPHHFFCRGNALRMVLESLRGNLWIE